MKIIDKTPLLDANGHLNPINRLQGTLKYGLSWPATLEAQQKVIVQLNKVIQTGYTLFRNPKLGKSEIIIPLVLIGTTGIYVLEVTPLKGFYRARGDEWGQVINGRFQPAEINLLTRTTRMAKALQVFFERQGTTLAGPIEPVLIAADPGMHIESVRPVIRVVMSDAIERFAASVLTASRPIYNSPMVNELVDRILTPRPASQKDQPLPIAQNDALAAKDETPFPAMEPSRMQSILNAPRSDALIENNAPDIGFAFEDDASASVQPTVLVSNPGSPDGSESPASSPASNRVLGMTWSQIAILVALLIVWACIMAVGVGLLYYYQTRVLNLF